MKKIILALALVFGVLVVGIVAIPFFIDVNQYRPEIVSLVNSQINGRFDLGTLKLSLWGEVAVQAEKAELKDGTQAELLSVRDFKLTVPLKSLFLFKPELRIVMKRPELHLIKNKQGVWNALTLLQNKKEETQKPFGNKEAPSTESKAVPSWSRNAQISLFLEDAAVKVEDLKSNSQLELNRLNLKTGALSLDKLPMFSLSGHLESKGPFEIQGEGTSSSLLLVAKLDEMRFPMGAFEKKPGSPARIRALISKSGDDYFLEGNLEPLQIQGGYLKQDLKLSGDIKASQEKLDKLGLKLQAKAFDVEISANVSSFESPRILARIDSSEMDLDELIDWDKMKKASLEAAEKIKTTEGAAPSIPQAAPSGSVPKTATGEISVNAKSLKFYRIRMEPIRGKFRLKDQKLDGSFDEAKVLGGKIKATAQVNLSSSVPQYAFQTQVENVSLEEAVASQMEMLRNSMTGSLSGEMTGKGWGLDAKAAKRNLDASGKMSVKKAKLTTIDINKMVSQGVNGVLSKVADKVPVLRGKELKTGDISSEFQKVTSSFTIKAGEFVAPDFFAEAIPKRGIDIKGSTRVGLLDYALKADWEVLDTYGLFQVDPILIERGKPFRIPVRIEGTLLSPKYDYAQIPEFLVQIALNNVGVVAKEKAQQELKKQAEEKVKSILKGIFK
ncbi:MAG: AsmA family protein [Pseudomonadota bacterium]